MLGLKFNVIRLLLCQWSAKEVSLMALQLIVAAMMLVVLLLMIRVVAASVNKHLTHVEFSSLACVHLFVGIWNQGPRFPGLTN